MDRVSPSGPVNVQVSRRILRMMMEHEKGPIGNGSKVVLIGLDGLPYSLLKRMTQEGKLPNFRMIKKGGCIRKTHSVLPTVSSVAWASIATGMEPCGHGIFGFVELGPKGFDLHIPTGADMKAPAIWEVLSERGRRVCSIGVPMTFPPPSLNGLIVSGFLAPSLDKAVSPRSYLPTLKELGYRIDVDPKLAHHDLDAFLEDLNQVFDARVKTMLHLLEQEPWDLFVTHFIDTDRINHFLWEHMERGNEVYAKAFWDFYGKVDGMLSEVQKRLGPDQCLIICSDHGFCSLESEIYLNYWLKKKGYLRFMDPKEESLKKIHPDSLCYALDPGRIYLMERHSAHKMGPTERDAHLEMRSQLVKQLEDIRDPTGRAKVAKKVYRREEVYHGKYIGDAPHIIISPQRGFELRGTLNKDKLHGRGPVSGVHSYEDAFLFITGRKIMESGPSITDIAPTIYRIMGERVPGGLDGRPLV